MKKEGGNFSTEMISEWLKKFNIAKMYEASTQQLWKMEMGYTLWIRRDGWVCVDCNYERVGDWDRLILYPVNFYKKKKLRFFQKYSIKMKMEIKIENHIQNINEQRISNHGSISEIVAWINKVGISRIRSSRAEQIFWKGRENVGWSGAHRRRSVNSQNIIYLFTMG